MDSKLIVIAIGGNSLIEDSKNVTFESQFEAARKTSANIAKLVAAGHRVVIAHGNGPQVGFILRRSEIAKDVLHTVPLLGCVADTQGSIGYQLQNSLYNEFRKLGIEKDVVTIVSQVLVDENDPSFHNPTKPIGTFMTEAEAMERKEKDGWDVMEDAGRGYRRVVASPKPQAIIELNTLKSLLSAGQVVIAGGGGGLPVVRKEDGTLEGRDAVIDKDLAAAIMAKSLNADVFLISTAVPKVCINFGKPNQQALDVITTADAHKYMGEGHFAPGSMLPKVQAITDYVETTGGLGIITDPDHLKEALEGTEGTRIVK